MHELYTYKIKMEGDLESSGSYRNLLLSKDELDILKKTLNGELYEKGFASFHLAPDTVVKIHESIPRSITFCVVDPNDDEKEFFESFPIVAHDIEKLEDSHRLFVLNKDMIEEIGGEEVIEDKFLEVISEFTPAEIYSFARDVGFFENLSSEMNSTQRSGFMNDEDNRMISKFRALEHTYLEDKRNQCS